MRTLVWILGLVGVSVALAVRVAPLVEGGDRLQRQCVSEDGYLMLTIARNFALGNGFSVSGGAIATNGTQPLVSLMYAACYWLVGGDRLTGLYPVVALQLIASILMAVVIYAATRGLWYRGQCAGSVALLAAALWFASPTSVGLSQNSLETGLYALFIALSIACYDVIRPTLSQRTALDRCLLLGVILGLTFLCRNDACFLIAALLGLHLLSGVQSGRARRALTQSVLIGLVSIAVASPWLWFNVTRFGHIVPVSGRAESLNVEFAHNLWPSFVALVEDATVILRIPAALQGNLAVSLLALATIISSLALAWWKRAWFSQHFSAGVGALAIFVGLLYVYYAFFFGMPSFLGRYFFPCVTLCALLGAAIVVNAWHRIPSPRRPIWSVALLVPAVVCCVGLNVRMYVKGTEHLHFQVVEWVQENVPEDVWVAAVQTGTLGYYHDRTLNLDGKVSPIAFEYRKRDAICEYLATQDAQYLVDWVGIARWAEWPCFEELYSLLLRDERRNLAVLVRREATAVAATGWPTNTFGSAWSNDHAARWSYDHIRARKSLIGTKPF